MPKLRAETFAISSLSKKIMQVMYNLYSEYYEEAGEDIFFHDLNGKDYAILLLDNNDEIKGFTTIELMNEIYKGKEIRIIFSGDTIIHHEYWGEQTLPLAWCEFAGKVKAESPNTPLYWLLITKGHRTYRYLPIFFSEYYPNRNLEIPEEMQKLIHYLSEKKFDRAYRTESCTLHHSTPQGHLKAEWADAERFPKNKEIQFFLSKNPDYAKGAELVCLAELSEKNLY